MNEPRELLDSHTHLWERARNPQDWIDPVAMAAINKDFTPADLNAAMAHASGSTARMGTAVVVQASSSEVETRELLAATIHSNISAVVGWVDLTGPDVAERLAALRAEPQGQLLAGIRHGAHTEPDPAWLLRADVGRGLQALCAAGLSFDLVVRPWQLPVATQLAAEHPELRFVLDHLGKPPIASGQLDGWRRDIEAVAALPNVAAKLSGLTIEANWLSWRPHHITPLLDHALAAFGPDRLMFGSDWPLVQLTGGYTSWLECYLAWSAALSPGEQASIDAGTARSAYAAPAQLPTQKACP